jgi:hypothetical protein
LCRMTQVPDAQHVDQRPHRMNAAKQIGERHAECLGELAAVLGGPVRARDGPSLIGWLRTTAARHPGVVALLCVYVFVPELGHTAALVATVGGGWLGWRQRGTLSWVDRGISAVTAAVRKSRASDRPMRRDR